MNRSILFSIVLLGAITTSASAQVIHSEVVDGGSLLAANRTGMYVLGGWAVANLLGGTAMSLNTSGSSKYFHLMNAGWNVINISLAGAALLSNEPTFANQMDLMNHQHKLEKTYLFNAGLDVGYMMAGLWMMEKSKNYDKNPQMLKGFGQSVIIQGAFLFAFDLVMYFVVNR